MMRDIRFKRLSQKKNELLFHCYYFDESRFRYRSNLYTLFVLCIHFFSYHTTRLIGLYYIVHIRVKIQNTF